MDKWGLVRTLRDDLAREIEMLTRAAMAAREAATHEESKPENDKDTRAVEAGYLAGAQAERVRDLTETAAALAAMTVRDLGPGERAVASAVVTVACEGAVAHYILAPRGGGRTVQWGDRVVQVATFASPMGRALVGCVTGDVVEVPRVRTDRVRTEEGSAEGEGLRSYEVLAVV